MFLIDDTKDSDSSNTHGKSSKEMYTKAAAPKAAPKTAQAESKDSYAKALDYVTASSNRAQALKLVMSKYEADFTSAQKKNLNDLA